MGRFHIDQDRPRVFTFETVKLAEGVGFESTVGCFTLDFESLRSLWEQFLVSSWWLSPPCVPGNSTGQNSILVLVTHGLFHSSLFTARVFKNGKSGRFKARYPKGKPYRPRWRLVIFAAHQHLSGRLGRRPLLGAKRRPQVWFLLSPAHTRMCRAQEA